MDVAHPIRSVVPSLDGPVLQVLAGTSRSLSTLEIHRLAGVGSSTGVRRVLVRLAEQGVAIADHRGNAIYYVANRDHLAWPGVEILAGMLRTFRERLVGQIDGWSIPPIHVSMFGSAARADGDAASDIDVLIVKPDLAPPDDEPWEGQLRDLRSLVVRLTGNRCQTFDVTAARLAEHLAAADPLVDAWLRDGLHLAGDTLLDVIAALPVEAGT